MEMHVSPLAREWQYNKCGNSVLVLYQRYKYDYVSCTVIKTKSNSYCNYQTSNIRCF